MKFGERVDFSKHFQEIRVHSFQLQNPVPVTRHSIGSPVSVLKNMFVLYFVPTSGGRSVDILVVRSRTKAAEL
jgi:hypothetical protein